jgi:hypothetical protein
MLRLSSYGSLQLNIMCLNYYFCASIADSSCELHVMYFLFPWLQSVKSVKSCSYVENML